VSTPVPSHKADFLTERGVAESYAVNSWPGSSSETTLDGVQSVSVNMDGQSTEISELNEDGVRRLLGRSDASFDVEINLDQSATDHQNLFDDVKDDTQRYLIVIDFDTTTTGFAIAAVCKIENMDPDLSDGAQTASFTFSNADGREFQTNASY